MAEAPVSNLPPLTPHLTVHDAKGAIEFYKRAFGAQEVSRAPAPDGRLMHAALTLRGALLMLSDDFPEYAGGKSRTPRAYGGTSVTLHLNVPDVDAAWQTAVAAGATVVMPVADMFWGDRYGIVADPYGHQWSLATPVRKVTDEEIRAGGAKVFPAKP